jgi:hypothetical protein
LSMADIFHLTLIPSGDLAVTVTSAGSLREGPS